MRGRRGGEADAFGDAPRPEGGDHAAGSRSRTRIEFRVAGQAEPISHFTDAVQAGDLLFVSGVVPVDGERRLVGGDDVVAQARAVFANMGEILAAAGCMPR